VCEFCTKHGEGKKWYLQAANYSDDLLSDLRRRKFIIDFMEHPESLATNARKLDELDRAPGFIKSLARQAITRRQKKNHFGQILPLEDIELIFEFISSVVRLPCICRQALLGSEQRYCYAITSLPAAQSSFNTLMKEVSADYLNGPNSGGLEEIGKEEALLALKEHEQEGLCHSVWTFMAPFTGAICNCDRTGCMGLVSTVTHDMPVLFRAEYVALTDPERCNGCRQCMRFCQFGAISYNAAHKKAEIDPRLCYGCGICRTPCSRDAIILVARSSVTLAAGLW